MNRYLVVIHQAFPGLGCTGFHIKEKDDALTPVAVVVDPMHQERTPRAEAFARLLEKCDREFKAFGIETSLEEDIDDVMGFLGQPLGGSTLEFHPRED